MKRKGQLTVQKKKFKNSRIRLNRYERKGMNIRPYENGRKKLTDLGSLPYL